MKLLRSGLLVGFGVVVILPVLWVFFSSVRGNQEILNSPFAVTIPPAFDNFGMVSNI